MRKSRETRAAEQWLIRRFPRLKKALTRRGFLTFAGGKGGGSTTQTASIPGELKPLINASVGQAIGLQNQLPIAGFMGPNQQYVPDLTPAQTAMLTQMLGFATTSPLTSPEAAALGTYDMLTQSLMPTAMGQNAALTPTEEAAISMAMQAGSANPFQNQAAGYAGTGATMSAPEQDALSQLGFFTSGALGESPATIAAQEAFRRFTIPEIEQSLALAGLGTSGAVGASIGDAEAKALVPFLQTEMAQRLQAAGMTADIGNQYAGRNLQAGSILGTLGSQLMQGQLGAGGLMATIGNQAGMRPIEAARTLTGMAGAEASLGNILAERARADTLAALQAAGMPRDVASQQAEALYNEYLRQQALSENVTLGPLDVMPRLIGSKTVSSGGGGMFGK